jgi:CHAT domain-containing protein
MAFYQAFKIVCALVTLVCTACVAQAQMLHQDMDQARPPNADGGLVDRVEDYLERNPEDYVSTAISVVQAEMAAEVRQANLDPGILSDVKFKALENFALSERFMTDLERAAKAFQQLLELRRIRLDETDRDVLITLNDYAVLIDRLGRDREAEQLYLELIELTRRAHEADHSDISVALTNYSSFLHSQGRFAEALTLQTEAVHINRKALATGSNAALPALNNYGLLLLQTGQIEGARLALSEALEAAGEITQLEQRTPLTIAVNYADVLFTLERYEEVASTIETKLMHLLRMDDGRIGLPQADPMPLKGLSLHAQSIAKLGRRQEAADNQLGLWSRATSEFGEDHSLTIALRRTLARIHLDNGEAWRAEDQLRELLDTMRSRASGLAETGVRGASQSNRESSRARATERDYADALWDALPERLSRIPELTADLSADERASIIASRAEDKNVYTNGALDSLVRATSNSTSSAVGEAAALRFAAQQGLEEIAKERQDLINAWGALEALVVRSQTMGSQDSDRQFDPRERLGQIEARIAEIDAELAAKAPKFFAILNQDLFSVFGLQMSEEDRYGQTEVLNVKSLTGKTYECADAYNKYRTYPKARIRSLRQCLLRSVLEEDEALLFLVPTERGTHSFAFSGDAVAWERSALDQDAIRDAIEEFRLGLEIQGGDESLPLFDFNLAHKLYNDLIAPVEKALAGKRRVYVVADGALSRLPLGTLVASPVEQDADPDDAEVLRSADWLADRYALVQLPSVQSLVYIREFGSETASLTGPGFAGFGAPVLDGEARLRGARSATLEAIDAASLVSGLRGGSANMPLMNPAALRKLSSLPGTEGELEQVRKSLGASREVLYLAERMTEKSIRSADLSSTRILHLATHGFTSEESGATAEPGLVFTPPQEASVEDDGYLAASEVVALDLSLAEWVILSACNTASPSGKPGETGLSGLAQAFFFAGAQSLLVSHWPVFDDIAPILTVEALKRAQSGEGRAEALQEAMRLVRNDPDLDAAHPAVWAPFTLVGEGR